MNKNEYIRRLAKGIEKHDIPNKYDILADYEQIFDEILIDNDNDFNAVIDKLGYPEILAMDIMEELGYEPKKSERQERQFNNSEKSNHRYDVKRQKSNIIWNIILAFYYLVQIALSLALISLIALVAYLGFNSSASFNTTINDNKVETYITICRENSCESFIYTFKNDNNYLEKNEFSIKKCYDQKCESDAYVPLTTIPIGFIFGLVTILVAVLIWLCHVIVYKNVKVVINRNNEYNRRRNYE